ncbi:MAG: hypothetical protein WCJ95_20705, partial [Mariniphaga sp.]
AAPSLLAKRTFIERVRTAAKIIVVAFIFWVVYRLMKQRYIRMRGGYRYVRLNGVYTRRIGERNR